MYTQRDTGVLRSGAHPRDLRATLYTLLQCTLPTVSVYACLCLTVCGGKWEKNGKHEPEYGRNYPCYCHYFRSVLENTFLNSSYIG